MRPPGGGGAANGMERAVPSGGRSWPVLASETSLIREMAEASSNAIDPIELTAPRGCASCKNKDEQRNTGTTVSQMQLRLSLYSCIM